MILLRLPLGIYAANCYIVGCPETKKACVIDPGGEHDKIVEALKEYDLTCESIVLTHGHMDHIGGLAGLAEKTGAQILIHEEDADMLKDPRINLSGSMGGDAISITANRLLKDNDRIDFGNLRLKVIHTPGHTPGSICLKINEHLFAGDTLFQRSVGRTDLAGGNQNALVQSIKKKLYKLPEDTVVYPGHGPDTTIGFEKKGNMVIRA
jgi:glyoxylase-like metal-dependent hydrolase (beta-lactamase superfamily II)